MKKRIFVLVMILALVISLSGCTEGCSRWKKDVSSNLNGGLERTLTVYDLNGNIVCQYEGKFDIETDNGSYILFDLNGKRHMIYYSTFNIIVDEK